MATPFESQWVRAGRSIERLGGRGTPIDHDRFLGTIPHAYATDVERIAKARGIVIDAAKHQRTVTDVELCQAIDDVLGEGLSLKARLVRASGADFEIRRQRTSELARLFERAVRSIQIRLFSFEFGVNRLSPVQWVANWGTPMISRRAAFSRGPEQATPRTPHGAVA